MGINNINNIATSKTNKSDIIRKYLDFVGIFIISVLVFNNAMQFLAYFSFAPQDKATVILLLSYCFVLVIYYISIKKIFS